MCGKNNEHYHFSSYALCFVPFIIIAKINFLFAYPTCVQTPEHLHMNAHTKTTRMHTDGI